MSELVTIPQSPVQHRRELSKVPEVIAALDKTEKLVFAASLQRTVEEYTREGLAAELADILRWLYLDIGYRAKDEDEEKYNVIRITELLRRHYPGLTMQDFRLAFELSLTGELDSFLPKDRNGEPDRGHYQQFNAEYVCKILNAYKGRRAYVLKKAREAAPVPEPRPDDDALRRDRNLHRKDLIDAYGYYCENGRLPAMTIITEKLIYDALADAGLAEPIVVTPEDKREIMQQAIMDFVRFGKVEQAKRLQGEGPEASELRPGAAVLARRNALIAAFERMRGEGVDITEFVKYE